MTGKYDDIIHLPHPVSKKHPQMSIHDRAAQFSPFAALTGHSAAIEETARLTDRKLELNEEQKAKLDQIWQYLLRHAQEHPKIKLTYFIKDERKEGGIYMTVTDRVKKVDPYKGLLLLSDGTGVETKDIYEIDMKPTPSDSGRTPDLGAIEL